MFQEKNIIFENTSNILRFKFLLNYLFNNFFIIILKYICGLFFNKN